MNKNHFTDKRMSNVTIERLIWTENGLNSCEQFARASFLCLLIKDTGEDKLSVKMIKRKNAKRPQNQ